MTSTIYVLNGPNLNLLGKREPEIYGSDTLADVEGRLADRARGHGYEVVFRQSNHEGQLIDWIQEARSAACGIIINPAAYTHTSVGLNDAVKAADVPVIEVHISNIHARESFRHHSYVSPVARAVVVGFGTLGYELALDGLVRILEPAGRA
jgi:3-dehydroquinate dehydratase II